MQRVGCLLEELSMVPSYMTVPAYLMPNTHPTYLSNTHPSYLMPIYLMLI